MPVYEFRCRSCNTRFEKICRLGEKNEGISCPKCGASSPVRVMSSFNAAGTEGGKGSSCSTCSARNCSSCGH